MKYEVLNFSRTLHHDHQPPNVESQRPDFNPHKKQHTVHPNRLRFVPFGPESTVLRFRFVAVCSWLPGPLNNDTQTRQLVTGDEIWLSLPNPIKYLSSSMPSLRIFSHWLKNIFCEALDIKGIGTIFAELRTQLQCWHLFMAIYK